MAPYQLSDQKVRRVLDCLQDHMVNRDQSKTLAIVTETYNRKFPPPRILGRRIGPKISEQEIGKILRFLITRGFVVVERRYSFELDEPQVRQRDYYRRVK